MTCSASERSPVSEGLGSRSSRATMPLAFQDTLLTCYGNLTFNLLCRRISASGDSSLVWQPWPAHEPFADEITRWWPSDDWPSHEPQILIEDTIPDVPPDVISWRHLGSLLDLVM